MNERPICQKCRLTMELKVKSPGLRIYQCPMCLATKSKVTIDQKSAAPKCTHCHVACVPQGEFFVCPKCRSMFDPGDDRGPILNAPMEREIPINRSHHQEPYRGGLEIVNP